MRKLSKDRIRKFRIKSNEIKDEFTKILAKTGNKAAFDHIRGDLGTHALLKAIEKATLAATQNFGMPDQILMSPKTLEDLQKMLKGDK